MIAAVTKEEAGRRRRNQTNPMASTVYISVHGSIVESILSILERQLVYGLEANRLY
jgi:hypothetical protein